MASTDWTFGGTWPYEPQWFDSPDGRLHYVDEGPRDGKPVVMVHGNPTWGYLYRNFIPPLVDAGYRCIVPDLLGFGRSDKPNDAELYQVPRHAERLKDKPTMIAWAMKDIAFLPEYLDELWLPIFPNADVLRLPDAGHYLQEDAHERIAPKLVTHLDSVFHDGSQAPDRTAIDQ
jgi:pimeloyl-ACP methyl ester carboxylesterase